MPVHLMKRTAIAALAAALALGPAPAQVISSLPNKNYVAIPNYTANRGLPKWQACRQKVINGTANCLVPVAGESTPRGLGAMFNSTANDAASGAWPAQVAVQLRQIYGLNAQSNSMIASGNIGANMAAFVAYDTRITNAHSWTVTASGSCATANLFVGGCAFQGAANTTTSLDFNPKNTTSYPSAAAVPTNTADVYSLNVNQGVGFADLKVGVNSGAALATIIQSGAGAATYTKTTVSTGSAAADNTWNMFSSSSAVGGALFDAIVLRNSAVSEASFLNAGISGASSVFWTANTTIYNPITAIQNLYQPDLCIWQLQGNDQDVGTAISVYKANLHALFVACQVSGDAMLVTSQPGNPLSVFGTAANSTLTCSAGVVTDTTASPHGYVVGSTPWVTIAGVTPSGYNGAFQVTVTGASTFTYSLSCPAAETVPGTWGITVPPYDNQATYAAAAAAQAAADGVPVLDWFTTMCGTVSGVGTNSTCSRGGWTAGVSNGWNGSFNGGAQDVVHQGPYAYGPLALQISQILMQ